MAVSAETRRRVIAVLLVALGFLVARAGAAQVGASERVETVLYGLAVLSLVVAVLLVAKYRIDDR